MVRLQRLPDVDHPARCLGSVFVSVALAVLRDGAINDVERLRHGLAVLVGRRLDVLVPDVVRPHLQMGVHASTRQAHASLLRCVAAAMTIAMLSAYPSS